MRRLLVIWDFKAALLDIPFEPQVFGQTLNVHLILEYLAFSVGFWYYVFLRKGGRDRIPSDNRLTIIIGAVLGAFVGSRIMGLLENPPALSRLTLWELVNLKTIMGGLFGGLLGVELIKKAIKETRSSGDLFVFPIILGLCIGRLGCFLAGVTEFTYGKPITSIFGMDLGDGILRHPLAAYEILFLVFLWFGLKRYAKYDPLDGDLFRWFMITYFGFRFFLEFLKPNSYLFIGLSSIQYLCIFCWYYYRHTLFRAIYAN